MAIVKGHQPDAQLRPTQARDDRGLTGGIERSPGNWLRCGTSAGTTIKSQKATIDRTEDVAISAALSGRHLSGSGESLMVL
jgi:hypothetical protein